jgi:hypothetical protein
MAAAATPDSALVRLVMEHLQLSPRGLARVVSVHEGTISKWLSADRQPTAQHRATLCHLLLSCGRGVGSSPLTSAPASPIRPADLTAARAAQEEAGPVA